MADPLGQTATSASSDPVGFADDGTPIFWDPAAQQFYTVDPARAHQGGREFIQPGDPRLRQAFGQAEPTGSAGPTGSWTSVVDAQGNVIFYNPTTGQQQNPGINVGDPNAITPQQQQQLDLQLQQLNQSASQFQQNFQQSGQQFDASQQQAADQFNASMFAQIEQANAVIRQNQAQLAEQIRQADIADAAAREQMRFAIRQVEVATAEGNANRLQNAVQIRANIQNQIQTIGLQRQSLVSSIEQGNAAIANNAAMYNATAKANADALNEQRRQTNLQQLQAVSSEIGTLAQNPADVGKLAAFLRAGQIDAISQAIARGEDAITDESLLGLRGLLGVRDELQKGPAEATPYLIDPTFANVPEFANDLGVAPEISDIFQPISFDSSGIEREATPAAPDYSQFFTQITQPAPVQAAVTQPQVAPTQQIPMAQPAPTPTAPKTQAQAIAEQPDIWKDLLSRLSPELGGTYGLEHGGMVPPGMPVRVGDSSDGKENEELAMVDAQGNLIVMPMDRLPKAETGGLFQRPDQNPELFRQKALRDVGQPMLHSSNAAAQQLQPRRDIGSQERIAQLQRDAASRTGVWASTSPDSISYGGGEGGTAAPVSANRQVPTDTSALLTPTYFGGTPATGNYSPTAQNVAQTAQNPSLGTGQIAPVSEEVARLFLSDVQRDALRRGGFTDPTQVSPLKVSAPGTSNYLQQLSASVGGVLGYGPPELFFEELRKLQPVGVGRGTARRTA